MVDLNFLNQAQSLIPAEVRMISGCEDYQTSADVSNISKFKLPDPAGRAGGACTSALLDILYSNSSQRSSMFRRRRSSNNGITFQQVLMQLREKLANDGFSQIPQLTSSRPLEIADTPFNLVGGNGQRRALIVGINYTGQNGQLSGCHNDAYNMKQYIQKEHGFSNENITLLLDDSSNPYPSRQAMVQALKNLVARSVSGDSVFFHYSGHGGLLEADGNAFKNRNNEYDQTLIPLDYERTGQIRDFTLFNNFIQPMKEGVTVTCIMDCCHSGSVLDLPYSFRATNIGEAPRMMENVAYLSNLAFLYTLAGNVLPQGFEDISSFIGNVIGGNVEDYQGIGLQDEEAQGDFFSTPDQDDCGYAPEIQEPDQEYEPPSPVVVEGFDVPEEQERGGDFGDFGDQGADDTDCCCDIMDCLRPFIEENEDGYDFGGGDFDFSGDE